MNNDNPPQAQEQSILVESQRTISFATYIVFIVLLGPIIFWLLIPALLMH